MRSFKLTTILVTLTVTFALHSMSGVASASSSYGGYCGPPVTSKAVMLSFYKSPEGQPLARAAEHWVRAHASYYHIQSDQGFLNWLEQPNVKYFPAPPGYKLHDVGNTPGNTYCPSDNELARYNGHYEVGGLNLLWWCKDPSGGGHECTPITKGYCRNFSAGSMIRKQHKHHVVLVPVKIYKIAEDAGSHNIPMPTGIFKFEITAKGYPRKVVTMNHDPEGVGHYKVGTKVRISELTPGGNDSWEKINPNQEAKVSSHGQTFVVKNREKATPPPPSTPPSPPSPPSKEGNCNLTITGNNNSNNSILCCANIESPSAQQSCECTGFHVHCKEKEEPKEPPKEPKCEPPKKGKFPNCKELPEVEWLEIQEFEPGSRALVCIYVLKGMNITSVKFSEKGGGGFFEEDGKAFMKGEKYCQYYTPASERPASGNVTLKVTVVEENDPEDFSVMSEETFPVKEEEPRPR